MRPVFVLQEGFDSPIVVVIDQSANIWREAEKSFRRRGWLFLLCRRVASLSSCIRGKVVCIRFPTFV